MKNKSVIFVILVLIILAGCKKDEEKQTDPIPDPPNNEEVIVAEETKVILPALRSNITSIDTSDFTIVFNGENDFLDSLQIGDILVDSISDKAPYGYLRKITSIDQKKDGETTVLTEQASLTEAVNKGSINFNTGLLTMGDVQSYTLAEGVTMPMLKNTDFTVFAFDYEYEFENQNGKIIISGYTELDIEFFFEFDWDFEWLAIPPHPVVEKFETGVEINQSASIMCVSEAGAGIQERILGTVLFTPWTFTIGPVPVVFLPV